MEELARIRQDLKDRNQPIFDFGTGDPKIPLWPEINKTLKNALTEVSQYPSIRGSSILSEAHEKYLSSRFGLQLNEDLISVPTRGSKEAVFHIMLSLVGRLGRKTVVFPSPGYPVYETSVKFAGGKPHKVELRPEDSYLLEPWELPEDVQRDCAAIWVNYPHNPTGACANDFYWKELTAWCDMNDVVLLSDDCYVDIFGSQFENDLNHQPKIPLQFHRKNVISFLSLSKRSGLTGYRCGMMVGDKDLLSPHLRARANMGLGQPEFIQQVAAKCWGDVSHVEERRKIFSERMLAVIPVLKSLGLVSDFPEATFYVWAKVPDEFEDDVSFALHLAKSGMIVTPGQWLGTESADFFRMALVPGIDETREALEILKSKV